MSKNSARCRFFHPRKLISDKNAPGALADLIAVPVAGNLAAFHGAIVHHDRPVSWTMLDGQILA